MKMIRFDQAFQDITKEIKKIPRKEYLSCGRYPIVDQGDGKIAGYTNCNDGLYTNVPVVLFGDHTRVFKYINFPFFAGADGTKILKAKSGTDAHFGYYSFMQHPLPSLGYSRHFKLLKDKPFHTTDYASQLRIAGILGSLDEKIELNRKKIAELEALAGVVYNQLVATNQCEYSTISAVATVKTGKQDSNFSTADGEYRFFTCSKDILWCDKYEFEGKAILLTGNGDLHVRYFDGKFNAYQRTYVLQPNDARLFSAIYLAVRAMLIRLARSASGSIVKFITKGDVEHIKVPAFKEQHQKLLNDCLSNVLNIEQEIDALIRIRDKLLPLLMNGQVVVK